MSAVFNEIDPNAAAWLRELIARGHIAQGDVDGRSVVDVRPADLAGRRQVHLFAGIGVWSYALRLAGWPDDRPVWTASCPCPPFSVAGKGQSCPECGGRSNICHPRRTGHFVCLDCGCDRFADDRHLWPEVARLIRECRPPVVFGEQVASADGRLWLGAVFADLEDMGYSVGGADLCAAGVGSPHIRQRLYWCAVRLADAGLEGRYAGALEDERPATERSGATGGLVDPQLSAPSGQRQFGGQGLREQASAGLARGRLADGLDVLRDGAGVLRVDAARGLADAECQRVWPFGSGGTGSSPSEVQGGNGQRERLRPDAFTGDDALGARPRPTDGFWRDADWLACRDGRWRPTIPSPFEMVDGPAAGVVPGSDSRRGFDYSREDGYALFSPLETKAQARVMRLRGYGNAIVAPLAAAFLETVMDALDARAAA